MWRPSHDPGFLNGSRHFDLVLEPDDIAATADRGATTERREEVVAVPPIRLLDESEILSRQEARRDPSRRALALIVTDGRTTERAAVARAAARLAHAAQGVVVFDGEQGPVRLNLAAELAEAAGARLLPLEALAA